MSASRPPLRVLVVHNRYLHRGGEDVVFERETQLLRDAGHEVETYERHNYEIDGIGAAALASQTLWSRRTTDEISALVARFRPDVAHVHNIFPLISPSVYPALKKAGVPIVQTLHNYRLMCVNAMLLRNGRPCEDCVARLPWRGVAYGCYRDSRKQSAVLSAALALHRRRTIVAHVDRFVVLTEFARRLFLRAGVPGTKIVVKPNFVPDQGRAAGRHRTGLLYVGRLSKEKGIEALTAAARRVPDASIDVIGDGPLASLLDGAGTIRLHGRQDSSAVREAMLRARFLLLPSVWYEGFPMTVVEAYEAGLPVIASDIGALREVVEDRVTGIRIPAGDTDALVRCMQQAAAEGFDAAGMSHRARRLFEERYADRPCTSALESIYENVIAHP